MGERADGGHLTNRQRVLFAIGTPGWQITASVVVSIGIYFYLPPEGAGTVEATQSRTLDRYTKEDAHEDHKRVDKWHEETGQRIYELSAEVNRLKGLHENDKKQ